MKRIPLISPFLGVDQCWPVPKEFTLERFHCLYVRMITERIEKANCNFVEIKVLVALKE